MKYGIETMYNTNVSENVRTRKANIFLCQNFFQLFQIAFEISPLLVEHYFLYFSRLKNTTYFSIVWLQRRNLTFRIIFNS